MTTTNNRAISGQEWKNDALQLQRINAAVSNISSRVSSLSLRLLPEAVKFDNSTECPDAEAAMVRALGLKSTVADLYSQFDAVQRQELRNVNDALISIKNAELRSRAIETIKIKVQMPLAGFNRLRRSNGIRDLEYERKMGSQPLCNLNARLNEAHGQIARLIGAGYDEKFYAGAQTAQRAVSAMNERSLTAGLSLSIIEKDEWHQWFEDMHGASQELSTAISVYVINHRSEMAVAQHASRDAEDSRLMMGVLIGPIQAERKLRTAAEKFLSASARFRDQIGYYPLRDAITNARQSAEEIRTRMLALDSAILESPGVQRMQSRFRAIDGDGEIQFHSESVDSLSGMLRNVLNANR